MIPIRVLHVVTYMGRGGLETMIMNYYRHIDRTKIQFDFLVHRDFEADYDKEIEELGGKIYHLPTLNPFSKVYLTQLDAFFAEHKEYQIVHSHLDCMAGIPLKYARKHGVTVRIAHAHSSNQTKDKKYLLKLLFKRNITKHATNLFACGEAAGKWMFHTDDFVVLHNAINARNYSCDPSINFKVRKTLGISEDTLVVGHVGRFAPPKNHEFLVKIFAEVVKNNSDSTLLLIGDGELRNKIEKQVEGLGLTKKVIFAGQRSDVNELLQAMNIFVFPSIYEGLPVSLIEAQAAGLPCLISDKVPIECKKTDLVEQIALDTGAEKWAELIIKEAQQIKRNTFEEIRAAAFDIEANAAWLERFYLNEYSKGTGK